MLTIMDIILGMLAGFIACLLVLSWLRRQIKRPKDGHGHERWY